MLRARSLAGNSANMNVATMSGQSPPSRYIINNSSAMINEVSNVSVPR